MTEMQIDGDLELFMLRLRGEQALRDAPAVMRGAYAAIVGGGGRMDGMPRAPKSTPSLPFNAAAMTAMDEIYATLLNWAAEFAVYLELQPTPLAIPYIATDREASRAPALPIGAIVNMTSTIAEWLLAADNAIAGTDKIAARYWRDVADHVEAARKSFVPDPKVREHPVFAARDCPNCEQRRTVIVNISEKREITCACTYCGFVIPHELTPRWLRKASWRWGVEL